MIIQMHNIDPSAVCVWADYACIDQDDQELQARGIQSLITYAARSQFVLTPSQPETEAMRAFAWASSPSDLVNYGERGWCRLETYIFLVVAELTGRSPNANSPVLASP